MKEIVVISGKGGTGKTSLTASFATLEEQNVIVGDCDVDAADMHLLLMPDFGSKKDFYSGEIAFIHEEDCISCGKCQEVCRFNAIDYINGVYSVNSLNCEGCGYCARVCPSDAIENKSALVGDRYISRINTGSTMVHAKLHAGADNSGKLVAQVKNTAKGIAKEKNVGWVLIDGSPGVGCPVVSSLTGADFVILVTEPSLSGLHDLKRVYQLVQKFGIKAGCIINKYNINTEISDKISEFLTENNITLLGKLPYDEIFTEAMINGKTITNYKQNSLSQTVTNIWNQTKEIVENK